MLPLLCGRPAWPLTLFPHPSHTVLSLCLQLRRLIGKNFTFGESELLTIIKQPKKFNKSTKNTSLHRHLNPISYCMNFLKQKCTFCTRERWVGKFKQAADTSILSLFIGEGGEFQITFLLHLIMIKHH